MVEEGRLLVANIIEEGRWGGPQKRISLVAKALRDLAVETVVILPQSDSSRFQEALRKGGVPFVALRLTRLGRRASALSGYFLSFVPDVVRIHRSLMQRPYDLVHISGGAWQIKGALAARWACIPVVWHLNDTKMPRVIAAVFSFLAPRLASAFFVAADRCRIAYLSSPRLTAFPCHLVPAPVDTRAISAMTCTPDVRISAMTGVKIVSVANINPVKGLDTLIAASAILHKSGHQFTVAVVGPVFDTQIYYFSSLKRQIEEAGLGEHVIFLGGVEDAVPCLKAADIYVCSSVAEASPMTVWEAMASAKPVVSTDVGDVAVYVRPGESGYVVPVADAQALAEAMAILITDADKRREFGEGARKIVAACMDLLEVAARTANGYRAVLAIQAGEHSGNDTGVPGDGAQAYRVGLTGRPGGTGRVAHPATACRRNP